MNVEAIPRFVQKAPFREIVWLAPGAYAVHIAEEFRGSRLVSLSSLPNAAHSGPRSQRSPLSPLRDSRWPKRIAWVSDFLTRES